MTVSSEARLLESVQLARRRGARIGFTCGVFDVLHVGHVRYLREARRSCDLLVAAVNSDRSCALLKGSDRPFTPFAERAALVAAVRWVDLVCELDDERPARLLDLLRPDVYVKGGDYDPSELRSAALVEAHGGTVLVIDAGTEVSTTRILERVEDLTR